MAEAKNKYTVKNTTILHNKKPYAPGATINLTDEERDKLVDYIVPVAIEEEVTETTTTKTSKTTKKNSEKAVDNSSAVDTNNDEKKEDVNGSETIQTPAD